MKIFVFTFFSIISLASFSQNNNADTTIKDVLISFRYTSSIFPPGWQPEPISAKGTRIDNKEIERSKLIMVKELKKYPVVVLQKNLQAVYFLKSMSFYNVGYGGTNSTDVLYLTNNGMQDGYSNLYLEQTFHHEFSSILYRNYPTYLDETAWKNVNPDNLNYNDPEAGVGAIRNNQSSQELDTALCAKGFLTQYALSGMENDINTIAQNLFSPSERFWLYTDLFPKINKKVKLLISFYNKIDPTFTESYFRKLVH